MKSAVILLSGGVDSTTCLALARSQNYICHTLSFSYGQRHSAELIVSEKISKVFGAASHQIIHIGLEHLGGSALTDKNIKVPEYTSSKSIPVTYVPARNTIFLAYALALAEVKQVDTIFIGVSAIDYSNYPDCRPEYISAFQYMANLATKAGVEGHPIHIKAPLIHLSKAETIRLGKQLGVDYSFTISCYSATEDGTACGKCDSCALRRQGFISANVADPTKYLANL